MAVQPASDRRVLITGVGGIGTEVARLLVADGAAVHLVDAADAVHGVANELGVGATQADLRTDAGVAEAVAAAATRLGGLNGLVAIAGGSGRRFGDGPVTDLTAAAIEQTVSLNLTTALLTLGAFVRCAQRPAAAVLVSSVLASVPNPLFGTHAYAAAKAGTEAAARAAAGMYAAHRIAVNVVAAGLTRTPMSLRAQHDARTSAFARAKQPLTADGFVEAEDVARACCWLLGARSVTGQVLTVDGGWSVTDAAPGLENEPVSMTHREAT